MIDHTIPARTAALIWATARRIGVSPVHLAHSSGLDPATFGDDLLRVPTESVWRVWELIDFRAGAGTRAGLLAAEQADRDGLHVWDYLFSSRPTLAESLRTVMELRAVVTDPGVGWEVIEDGGLLTIRCAVAVEPEAVLAPVEVFVLAVMLRRVRAAVGRQVAPVRVRLTQPPGPGRGYLVDEFGTGNIDFDAPHSEITFLDVGALPTGSDPRLGALLSRHAELSLAAAHAAPTWHDKLRAAVHQSMAAGALDLADVARRLATSPRTLQRRLQEEGTSWRAEVDAARHRHAVDLLRETALPLQSVATRVGYTDARALRRAFQRWTGTNPDAFRRGVPSGA
ncbi:AraC family transcriptional regulator [Nocardia acidivorans]|uniref:AraC family transcriptional regulator n=1 Tax=Nocardia acidivorans TaxID=404580 RepID=UPI0008375DA2|nr:AraC family transcriptional regulator [Nocardia acidivorans]